MDDGAKVTDGSKSEQTKSSEVDQSAEQTTTMGAGSDKDPGVSRAVADGSHSSIDDLAEFDGLDDDEPDVSRPPSPVPLDIPETSNDQESLDRRIYILGAGSVGCFVAHSLRGVKNPPPITLLLHTNQTMREWDQCGRTITLTEGNKKIEHPATGIDVERVPDLRKAADGELPISGSFPTTPIANLIVATKSIATATALKSVAHRLGPSSTVCFLQNGMGAIDEVNEQLFPDTSSRPRYIVGIVSHGLFTRRKFFVEHRGKGTIALSIQHQQAREREQEKLRQAEWSFRKANRTNSSTSTTPDTSLQSSEKSFSFSEYAVSSQYMLSTLVRAPSLSAMGLYSYHLQLLQLEKLASNCIINPLTAIYNCRNGELGVNPAMRAVMRLLIAEISLVFRNLPELAPPPGYERTGASNLADINKRFSPAKLEYRVLQIMKTTALNHSSMWQDVHGAAAAGRTISATEIRHINGWIVKRGEELGFKCVLNYMMCKQVEAMRVLVQRRGTGLAPMEKFTHLDEATQARLLQQS